MLNMFRNKKRYVIIGAMLILIGSIIAVVFFTNNSVEALSKYGSRGEEVRQIQTKLKRWGYYNGNVDGIYGNQTVTAVKYFQRKNGLSVDGIAGPATLKAMGIYSSGSSSSGSSTSNSSNVSLLARVIYGEARGEPYTRASCSRSSRNESNQK